MNKARAWAEEFANRPTFSFPSGTFEVSNAGLLNICLSGGGAREIDAATACLLAHWILHNFGEQP